MARFEIEEIFEIQARGWFVMARALDDTSAVGVGPAFLGPIAVDGGTIPRKVDAAGAARTDIWIFRLSRAADPRLGAPGQVVEWISREAASL